MWTPTEIIVNVDVILRDYARSINRQMLGRGVWLTRQIMVHLKDVVVFFIYKNDSAFAAALWK